MSEELKKYLIDTITQIQENANRVCKPYYDRLALFEGMQPIQLFLPATAPPPSKTVKLEAFAREVYDYWLTTDDLDDFHYEGRKLLESVGKFDEHDNFELGSE
jgi:hypothetical protein